MKEFFSQKFYGNTIENWAISFGIILAALIIAKICYWAIGKFLKKFTDKTKTNLDDILVDKLEEPIVYGMAIIGFYWGFNRLEFGQSVDDFFANMFIVIFTLNVTWLFVRTIDALIEEYVVPLVSESDSDLDDQILPMVRKVVKIMLWALGIIIGMNNAGFDVAALIAGLGIGGLAIALAAQDTVKNIFGGVMIFADKPFQLNERIKVNGWDGSVEEIGIRSTRLRTLEGRMVTIPNGQFSDNAVENVDKEPTRKVVVNLGLTYETDPTKMDEAMQMLRDIAAANPLIVEEDVIVSFNSWGDFAMGILFIYYVKDVSQNLQVQTDINMAILRQFNAAGIEFAYPTQTVYRK